MNHWNMTKKNFHFKTINHKSPPSIKHPLSSMYTKLKKLWQHLPTVMTFSILCSPRHAHRHLSLAVVVVHPSFDKMVWMWIHDLYLQPLGASILKTAFGCERKFAWVEVWKCMAHQRYMNLRGCVQASVHHNIEAQQCSHALW